MIRPLVAAGPDTGPKAETLGRLLNAGLPVPPGIVIPFGLYGEDLGTAGGAGAALAAALVEVGDGPYAVRSSASGEDTAGASGAGQYASYLAVPQWELARRIVDCWASLSSPRAVAYRRGADAQMAVIVQQHVDADVAGVLFTGDPTVVEASWGLGESVVSGLVTPDAFTIARSGITRRLGTKQTRRDRTRTTQVPPESRDRFCLTDTQLRTLHDLARAVVGLLGTPQDIEFAFANNHLWLLQSRPITTPLNAERPGRPEAAAILRGTPGGPEAGAILRGTPGSPGVATGPARCVRGPDDFSRVRAGDILVCRFTDPAWTPLFGVIGGIVTETGGRLSHAAIVAREHRIPAVLGVPDALAVLADDTITTIDGSAGTIS
ncbi:PEP/pyruvate-binding domain-containing protein [Kribbella sp. NPDC026611]|uniref:PEP/pyruvate-binding domain-containing protein n=1 Tax=Kribbella sp. NPDC026611 TaxID=3154911 RepID=UPI0033ED24CD